jgi:ElaB/YqjD/DUF883 family membrane-anchored ribosome-binding protein
MEQTRYGTSPSTATMSNNLDNTLSKASSGAHAAVDSMADAADSAFQKTKPGIDKVAGMAHRVVDKAAASAAPAVDWLDDKSQQLDQTQKKLVNDTCAYISANPLTSIGLAVLAGMLLSRMTRSSS